MPQELPTWRAARAQVSHDLIERTLSLYLSELAEPTGVDDAEIREEAIRCWEERVKPLLAVVVERAPRVLSPRLLLSPMDYDEPVLAQFEAVAYEMPLPDGAALASRLAAVKDATQAADTAMHELQKAATPDAAQSAQHTVAALRTALRALPTSPVIP